MMAKFVLMHFLLTRNLIILPSFELGLGLKKTENEFSSLKFKRYFFPLSSIIVSCQVGVSEKRKFYES